MITSNYVFLQQEINIKISDDAPAEYMKEVYKQIDTKQPVYGGIVELNDLKDNLRQNCVPDGFENMNINDYQTFLEQRRKLMAQKIKDYYFSL